MNQQVFSPSYAAFHRWLTKNRGCIAASKDCTVIYSGMDSGDVPLWKQLPKIQAQLRETIKPGLQWEPIETVLRSLRVDWDAYTSIEALPTKLLSLRSIWDFGVSAQRLGLITRPESHQVWKNLSAWYVKNASGGIYVFAGDTLKKYPDLLMAEIPVLVKNKRLVITAEIAKKLESLVPSGIEAWQKYRADSQMGRLKGREDSSMKRRNPLK